MHAIRKFSLIWCISLTGCVVADMDSSNYDYFPYVQTFQNPQTMGHTNVQNAEMICTSAAWTESFRSIHGITNSFVTVCRPVKQ